MGEKTKYLIIGMLILAIAQIAFISATENGTTNETLPDTIATSEPETMEDLPIENPIIELDIDNSIELGEEILLEITIDPKERDVTKITIDWDDGHDKTITSPTLSIFGIYFIESEYEYEGSGNFEINVNVYCSNEICASESISIEVEETTIPDEKPTVTLISPSQNYVSKQDTVTFTFKVTDDHKIDSCLFEIYKKEDGLKVLEYEDTHANPPMNQEIGLTLQEFEDGNYSWYITCEDNNSKDDTDSRDIIIKTVNHEREKEILALLENIDKFLEKEKTFSPEEQETITELKIIDDLRYYKKRLLQINQDLGNNLKYITDSTLREQRKIESYLELDEIKYKVPTDIKITNSENFVKNSLTNPMEEITKRYIDSQKIELSQNKIKRLSKLNEALQSKLTTKVSIKQIEIEYNETVEKITLVTKTILISDPEIKTLIEVFPENFETEIIFITKPKEIGENLYEFTIDDLENFEIKYMTKENTNVGILKETETIIFQEQSLSRNGINAITGFSIFGEGIQENSIYLGIGLSALITLFLSLKFFKKKNLNKWKKDENVKNTIHWITQAKEDIKESNIGKAKEKYHKTKEVFHILPEDFKHQFYEEIEKVRIEIDKNEIKDLIREYENAKKENRTSDVNKLYRQISTKYKNLPKKYQAKVYERIVK